MAICVLSLGVLGYYTTAYREKTKGSLKAGLSVPPLSYLFFLIFPFSNLPTAISKKLGWIFNGQLVPSPTLLFRPPLPHFSPPPHLPHPHPHLAGETDYKSECRPESLGPLRRCRETSITCKIFLLKCLAESNPASTSVYRNKRNTEMLNNTMRKQSDKSREYRVFHKAAGPGTHHKADN